MSQTDPISKQPVRHATSDRAYGIGYRNILLSVALSLVVVAVIAVFTYEPGALDTIRESFHPLLMGLAIATVVGRIVLGAWRLQYVSHYHLRFGSAMRGQLAWDFFSIVTPSVIGGGPLAGVYLARDGNVKVGEATALLFFAMLLDQLFFALTVPILVVATFFIPVFPPALGTVGMATFLLYFAGLLGWVLMFAYVTFLRPQVLEKLLNKIFRIRWLRKYETRVATEMFAMQERAKLLRSQPATFYLNAFGQTLLVWITRYFLLIFIVWSVFENLDVLLALARTAAMTLGSLVIPTPGGSGGVEGLYALFLGPPIMPKILVAPTLLLWRILGYYIYIALGGYLTMHRVREEMKARKNKNAVHGLSPDGQTSRLADEYYSSQAKPRQ